jgi:hypothetical protein
MLAKEKLKKINKFWNVGDLENKVYSCVALLDGKLVKVGNLETTRGIQNNVVLNIMYYCQQRRLCKKFSLAPLMYMQDDWILFFTKLPLEQIRGVKWKYIPGKQMKKPQFLCKNIVTNSLRFKVITQDLITQEESIWALIWMFGRCSTYMLDNMKKADTFYHMYDWIYGKQFQRKNQFTFSLPTQTYMT